MLLDANVLIYAVDESAPLHARARSWLEDRLSEGRRVGIPWPSLLAFARIVTHPRTSQRPLPATTVAQHIRDRLAVDVAWVPAPGPTHASVLTSLLERHRVTGNLIPDLHLAALALEHGLTVVSNDSDFARFPEVRWENPLR